MIPTHHIPIYSKSLVIRFFQTLFTELLCDKCHHNDSYDPGIVIENIRLTGAA